MGSSRRELRGSISRVIHSPLFEPLASIAVVAIIILSLYLYTGNWPPMVVVESNSMQHGPNDVLGVVNTGDIVLVKSESVPSDIMTYVDSEVTGYATYGEPGDVLLYYPNGVSSDVPVIHRAIVWLDYDSALNEYSAPSLFSLQCGNSKDYVTFPVGGGPSNPVCPTDPTSPINGNIELFHVGWMSVTVTIDLSQLASDSRNQHSGFITMGDNNFLESGVGEYDQEMSCAISCLVASSWVLGVARGMIPWFGALKLWISGQTMCYTGPQGTPIGQCVPQQSWDYLSLCIVLIIVLPLVVPWTYRHLRKAYRNRRREESSTDEKDETSRSR
jgi:signal peptidase